MIEVNKDLVLIDGSGFIFRAYHALPPLTRSDGTPIGAVLGFCNMLLRFIQESTGKAIVVVFDAGSKTFRNDLYSNYKANRSAPPDDLIPQFKLIREAVDAFGLTRVEKDGYEADDIIATYATLASKMGWQVKVVSSDKDLMQLVNDKNTVMYDPMKMIEIGSKEVFQKFGVRPEKVIQVQALAGDSTDNIPGVPGIGVKIAAELINKYGDIENLIENVDEIKQIKRKQKLKEHAEDARLSLSLVSLKKNVPLNLELDNLIFKELKFERLSKFFLEQGFQKLQSKIDNFYNLSNKEIRNYDKKIKKSYELITDENKLIHWINSIKNIGIVSIDTETTSLLANEAELVGISLAIKPGMACYIPLGHKQLDENNKLNYIKGQLTIDFIKNKLKTLLSDKSILKIGQNIKYDITVLNNIGILDISPIDDTMLLSYVLDAGLNAHNLDDLAKLHLSYKTLSYKEVVGTGKNQISFDLVSLDVALEYAAEDADITLRLWEKFRDRISIEGMATIYETIERPLVSVIAQMEQAGILINEEHLEKLSKTLQDRLLGLERDIFNQVGKEFNIASPKQLGEVLFEEMSLPKGKKGKSGSYGTGADILEELADDGHLFPRKILNWRSIAKLQSTYTHSLIDAINKKSGRVHTSFQMTGAQTGRLSSSEPNLQNIPIRTKDGREIRKAFVAKKDFKLVCCDYSQIELRILAELADVKNLKDAFKKNLDIHLLTASEVFGIPISQIDSSVRRNAKAINFGIIYGQSAFGLSRQIGVSQREAKEYIDSYFFRYPGIREYMQNTKEFAYQEGLVKTLFGRRIHVKGVLSKNPMERRYAERQAINAPIQGSAADIIKRAMIKLASVFKQKSLNCKILLQVHDELIIESSISDSKECGELAKKVMEEATLPRIQLEVPLVVDVGIGDTWEEAH